MIWMSILQKDIMNGEKREYRIHDYHTNNR